MTKSILIYCWKGCDAEMNLGEWFCEPILKYLGYNTRYYPRDSEHSTEPVMLTIGSNFCKSRIDALLAESREVRVWGHGNGNGPRHAINLASSKYKGRVKVFALRGPLSAQQANVSGVPLCDPGFLLPRAIPIDRQASRETFYVPHHRERPGAEQRKRVLGVDTYLDVIMPPDRVKPTIHRLANAAFVLTSTLHTMVLCLGYGVPCARHMSAKAHMPQRWSDLFASMGSPVPVSVANIAEGRRWWEEVGRQLKLPDSQALLRSFPHHLYP